jgi:hypothetical protein
MKLMVAVGAGNLIDGTHNRTSEMNIKNTKRYARKRMLLYAKSLSYVIKKGHVMHKAQRDL